MLLGEVAHDPSETYSLAINRHHILAKIAANPPHTTPFIWTPRLLNCHLFYKLPRGTSCSGSTKHGPVYVGGLTKTHVCVLFLCWLQCGCLCLEFGTKPLDVRIDRDKANNNHVNCNDCYGTHNGNHNYNI